MLQECDGLARAVLFPPLSLPSVHGEDGVIRTLLSCTSSNLLQDDGREAEESRESSRGSPTQSATRQISIEIVSHHARSLAAVQDPQGCICRQAGADPSSESPHAHMRARRTQLLREEGEGMSTGEGELVTVMTTAHACLLPMSASNGNDASSASSLFKCLQAQPAEDQEAAEDEEGAWTPGATSEGSQSWSGRGRSEGMQGVESVGAGRQGVSNHTRRHSTRDSASAWFRLVSLSTATPATNLHLFELICPPPPPPARAASGGEARRVGATAADMRPCARLVVAGIREQDQVVAASDEGKEHLLGLWRRAAAQRGYEIVYVDSSKSSVFLRPDTRAGTAWRTESEASAGNGLAFVEESDEVEEAAAHVPERKGLETAESSQVIQVEAEAEGGNEEGETGEWEAERAAVRGRVPVVFLHWTMPDCHVSSLPMTQ